MMPTAEELYLEIGASTGNAKAGNMFGWRCFKYRNKPFLFFDEHSQQAMVFKLGPDSLAAALSLPGAGVFNPGGKGKPMKNWAVVPVAHSPLWRELALQAYQHIVQEVQDGAR